MHERDGEARDKMRAFEGCGCKGQNEWESGGTGWMTYEFSR